QLQCHFTPGFEKLLEQGTDAGWFDPNNTLQLMVFHWVFIPWFQQELNNYQACINNTQKCCNKNKVRYFHASAKDYGALHFKVMVSPEAMGQVCQVYINPAHPVFDLLPPALGIFIDECYTYLGRPSVSCNSAWAIYCNLLGMLYQHSEIACIIEVMDIDAADKVELPLLEGLQELPFNETNVGCYMGGIGNGLGLQQEHLQALVAMDKQDELDLGDNNDVDSGPHGCLVMLSHCSSLLSFLGIYLARMSTVYDSMPCPYAVESRRACVVTNCQSQQ
ncbi:hypothetical protein PAXRUDRAFT_151259, partial [Paxillus rubicundulus Ve08.2h10]